jgi:hypothetical protein
MAWSSQFTALVNFFTCPEVMQLCRSICSAGPGPSVVSCLKSICTAQNGVKMIFKLILNDLDL